MPTVNPLTREVTFKVVYYGPGLGGKTTTLKYIFATTKPEHRGKMVSLATPVDRTLYFDYLPLRLPTLDGMAVRLQLFTVPGQVHYNATRKLVLTGADGIVFVADSQPDRLDANLESLENMEENLREQGRDLLRLPHVIAYNKRDLDNVLTLQKLSETLGRPNIPEFATSATSGEGVYEALGAISRAVVEAFERDTQARPKQGMRELEAPESGLLDALREMRTQVSVPELPDSSPPPSAFGESMPPAGTLGISFVTLWEGAEQLTASELERAVSSSEHPRAIDQAGELVSRSLASVASSLGGSSGVSRDPAVVALLLGIEGPRYLAFRNLVRRARTGEELTLHDALTAYGFAIDARVRERMLGASGAG